MPLTFPTPASSWTSTPWTDPDGLKWIYIASIPRWARFEPKAPNGLVDYSQIEGMPNYPTAFPPAAHDQTLSTITDAGTFAPLNYTESDTPPLSPNPGDEWLDTTTLIKYKRYDNFWVDVSGSSVTSASIASALSSGDYTLNGGLTLNGAITFNSTNYTFGTGSAAAMRYAMIAAPRDEAGNVTLALADYGLTIRLTAASGTSTITIPQVSSVAFPVGFYVMVRRAGAGTLLLGTSGITVNGNAVSSIAQYGEFALRHLGSNVWDFI